MQLMLFTVHLHRLAANTIRVELDVQICGKCFSAPE